MEPPGEPLTPILADLQLGSTAPVALDLASADPAHAGKLKQAARRGVALARLDGLPPDESLCPLRDALWPECHLVALYRVEAAGQVRCRTVGEERVLGERALGGPCTLLVVRERVEAMGQASTRAKFDANAPGWNGNPGSPGYAHYRWMRRLLVQVARPELGCRALDAGCGTGWVAVEAALRGAMVSAFDPSPAMVELARANAGDAGVDLDARVGFVEEVDYEQPFDLVLNSGVISFAPDPAAYLDRLAGLVRPGGLLVIGDINPSSRGFRRRRRRRPLLPARELNGLAPQRARSELAARGMALEGAWNYQLTWPVPELMAASEQHARGLGCGTLLALNRAAAWLDHCTGARGTGQFDSWILRARKAS